MVCRGVVGCFVFCSVLCYVDALCLGFCVVLVLRVVCVVSLLFGFGVGAGVVVVLYGWYVVGVVQALCGVICRVVDVI